MRIDSLGWSNVEVLDRICEAYGFSQKIQLANHFDIASSSLSNRYTRGAISYDFAAHCALETGASLRWLLTGKGERFAGEGIAENVNGESVSLKKFTLSEGKLIESGSFSIERNVIGKAASDVMCVESDGAFNFIERTSSISDGPKLVDIDGSVSIREIAVLPGKKLHVTGGKVPFECSVDDIKLLGRVIGIYNEVN
ncbi:MAG: phage repressor protein CI [Candidatus Symbiopectobacterium sp. Dall1.0]|nr:phage repressor protein CI [Candidatus Symbiopectobacterium sp. Dall1.0]